MVAVGEIVVPRLGEIEVVGVGSTLGAIEGDSVGLAVGTVSASNTSLDSDSTKRTTPAPSGGTERIVQPGPAEPEGEQTLVERSPTVTSTLMYRAPRSSAMASLTSTCPAESPVAVTRPMSTP